MSGDSEATASHNRWPPISTAADLAAIKSQCAQRLLHQLRDPRVRADKGSTKTFIGDTSCASAVPPAHDAVAHTVVKPVPSLRQTASEDRLDAARSPPGQATAQRAMARHSERQEWWSAQAHPHIPAAVQADTSGVSELSRVSSSGDVRRPATNSSRARAHSNDAGSRRPWGWRGPAYMRQQSITPRTPSRSSGAGTPGRTGAYISNSRSVPSLPDNCASEVAPSAAAALLAAVGPATTTRRNPSSEAGAAVKAEARTTAAGAVATVDQRKTIRARSLGQQKSAAMALRMAMTQTPNFSERTLTNEAQPSSFSEGTPSSARGLVPSGNAETVERKVGLYRDERVGSSDVREALVGTVQRLRELEEERRRLFDEYDRNLVRAASWTRVAPSTVAHTFSMLNKPSATFPTSEVPHAADGAAGAASLLAMESGKLQGSPKTPPNGRLTPTASGSVTLTSTSVRSALSAASERADAQLTELLRKSDRLKSLLADATATP